MRKLFLLLGGIMFFALAATSQRTVTGKVTDKAGAPIPNASVVIKGYNKGIATNEQGAFTISLPSNAKVLVITAVGFAPLNINVSEGSNYEVALEANEKSLEEVVVTGYGTMKKTNVTASITKVDGSKFANKPRTSLDDMLQGAAPGVQATATTGQPGAVTPIRIRGVGSFSYSGSSPLYIIDGVQINSGDLANGNGGGFNINPSTNVLATLNSDDIESVSILKDAAAISIYGSSQAGRNYHWN